MLQNGIMPAGTHFRKASLASVNAFWRLVRVGDSQHLILADTGPKLTNSELESDKWLSFVLCTLSSLYRTLEHLLAKALFHFSVLFCCWVVLMTAKTRGGRCEGV